MRILLDENVARPIHHALLSFITAHSVEHIHDLEGWSGTRDVLLYERAGHEGFHAILTNDEKQLARRSEVEAIARSGVYWIQYPHKNKGLVGIGIAIAVVCAGLPLALEELECAPSQRLIKLHGIDPRPRSRVETRDPLADPPKFWPAAQGD